MEAEKLEGREMILRLSNMWITKQIDSCINSQRLLIMLSENREKQSQRPLARQGCTVLVTTEQIRVR